MSKSNYYASITGENNAFVGAYWTDEPCHDSEEFKRVLTDYLATFRPELEVGTVLQFELEDDSPLPAANFRGRLLTLDELQAALPGGTVLVSAPDNYEGRVSTPTKVDGGYVVLPQGKANA